MTPSEASEKIKEKICDKCENPAYMCPNCEVIVAMSALKKQEMITEELAKMRDEVATCEWLYDQNKSAGKEYMAGHWDGRKVAFEDCIAIINKIVRVG